MSLRGLSRSCGLGGVRLRHHRGWFLGTGLGALVALVGVVVTARSTGRLAAVSERVVGRRYGITVGVEFTLIGAGAAVLGSSGLARWIPVWVCMVVGVHFFPLAWVLETRSLHPLGGMLSAVAVAALVVGLASTVEPSTITGPGAGLCLLAFALATLFAGGDKHRPSQPHPSPDECVTQPGSLVAEARGPGFRRER